MQWKERERERDFVYIYLYYIIYTYMYICTDHMIVIMISKKIVIVKILLSVIVAKWSKLT